MSRSNPGSPAALGPAGAEDLRNLYCRIENFLPAREFSALFATVRAAEAEFQPSTTTSGDTGHRRSTVMYDFPEPHRTLFHHSLRRAWPIVAVSLSFPAFRLARIVAQIAVHGNGDYYRFHKDNNRQSVARRTVSFVYYFHPEPRRFAGGELAFADDDARPLAAVTPVGNSIVFFPSGVKHEVREVRAQSAFHDRRFAVNGWLYR
jgi:SM-20-related protein